MCLIIFAPHINRAKIRRAVLERAFLRNSDGAGFAYVKDGELTISKMHVEFEAFFKALQRVRSSVHKGPLLIHMRWGTCGPNNETNTQPLNVYTGHLVMAHNGIFPGLTEAGSDVSDSVRLARLVRRAGWDYPFAKAQVEMLEALCDQGSKLVFVDNKGRHTIVNEKKGHWRAGAWYSNHFAFKLETLWDKRAAPDGIEDDPELRAMLAYERYMLTHRPSHMMHEDYDADQSHPMDPPHQRREPIIRQTGILTRPKVREGIPYAKMSAIEKNAFEAYREQEERAARMRGSLPQQGGYWNRHSQVAQAANPHLVSRDEDFIPRNDI